MGVAAPKDMVQTKTSMMYTEKRFNLRTLATFGNTIPITLLRVTIVKLRAPDTRKVTAKKVVMVRIFNENLLLLYFLKLRFLLDLKRSKTGF